MAGKKFAAEFALRRNVSAQDKILIQDSDDDVVKYAYPPQIASLSGYAYAQSVADLPLLPTNKSIGYIVGQMLYIYVGMGGDTKDGLYQSVGFFVGPQGVQGEKGEKGERGEQGVQGPKGDNGGLSLQELDEYLDSKQYVTGDTLAGMLAGYVSNTSLMRDYVTIAKTQDVTGVKNFTTGLQFDGVPMYKSKGDTVFLDGNLVVRGGITAFGTNETISPSIFEALPIDGATLKRTENGVLYVDTNVVGGGGSGEGSVDPSQLEKYLKPYAKTADVANTYATIASLSAVTSRLNDFLSGSDTDTIINKWSELEKFLAGLAESDDLATILSGKANKATTLAGYGITDAYTKSHIDSNFVTIGTKQEITGEKDFVGGFKVNGGLVEYNATLKAWVLNGDLLVTGGVSGAGGKFADNVSIAEGKNIMMRSANAQYYAGIGYDTSGNECLALWAKNTVTRLRWSAGVDFSAGITAGAMMGITPDFEISKATGAAIGYIAGNTILHSDNYSKYALPLTGGVVNGDVYSKNYRTDGVVYIQRLRIENKNEINGYSDYNGGSATGNAHINYTSSGIVTLCNGGGNCAIGGISASEKLHVYGNLLATGGVTATNSSDKRLKRNLRKFNASKVLMSLGGVYEYEYVDSEVQKNHIYEGTHYGLIYQNVKGTTLDVMCHEREDGFGTLNYIHPKFISLIAGAIMENISEVEKLKRKIRHLENKVKQLESRA